MTLYYQNHTKQANLGVDVIMPSEICKGCGDWQVAGAEYEKTEVDGTRPFWYTET